jgi:hypothetical protein
MRILVCKLDKFWSAGFYFMPEAEITASVLVKKQKRARTDEDHSESSSPSI